MTIQPVTSEQTYALRHAVLWPDKPLDYVKIENDHEGHHYGAFVNGALVGIISVFVEDSPKLARFRKFAVDPNQQRQGIGTRLLHYVMADARRLGATTLWCDARLDSAGFYRRFGMEAVSEVFYKGPIPYAKFSVNL